MDFLLAILLAVAVWAVLRSIRGLNEARRQIETLRQEVSELRLDGRKHARLRERLAEEAALRGNERALSQVLQPPVSDTPQGSPIGSEIETRETGADAPSEEVPEEAPDEAPATEPEHEPASSPPALPVARATVLRLAVLAVPAVLLAVSVGAAWLAVRSHREEQRVGLESVATLVGSAERAVQAPLARAARLSDEEEERVGEEVARQAGWPPATEAAVGPHVEGLGALIAEGLSRRGIRHRFLVTESARANAWALPGGRIHVTTAMLRLVDDEAELASVLGHEAAHVDLRHRADRVTLMERADQGLGGPGRLGVAVLAALTQPSYSEEQELEADAAAVRLVAMAGYDPVATIDLLEKLATLEGTRSSPERVSLDPLGLAANALDHSFATHPPAADRARALAPVVGRPLRKHPRSPRSPRYRGARNLRERVPFASQAWPEESAAGPSPLAGK